jgi:ribosomal protein S18 acetylase RimI-like enzyme/SAM-dependent methyltransferase
LAFLAAEQDAHAVFAVEPVGNLRMFTKEQARKKDLTNVFTMDGLITDLPFPDGFVDITMGGHVFGDEPEAEHAEMVRITKDGGLVILCPGNNDKDEGWHQFLVDQSFEWSRFEEPSDGIKRKYWKTKKQRSGERCFATHEENTMSIKPRPYNGIKDFIVMTSILAVGRKTTSRPYYLHTGDLSWWVFCDDYDEDHWCNHVCIWEMDGRPIGWSLIDPAWYSFDVYLLPEMRGTKEETYILDWTIHRLTKSVRETGGGQIRTVWVSENDEDRFNQLMNRGFVQSDDFMWYMERPLDAHIPDIRVPEGFNIRSMRGKDDTCQRAVASYNAFGSTRHFDEYWPRYQRFMQSPVYNPSFDLVAETPDGEFASFCILWPDPVNHIGLFEPVGTQANYQSQGVGRAIVAEGLRQLKTWGMDRAMVCIEHDDDAAIRRYQALGFSPIHKLHTYVKTIGVQI